MNMFKKVGIGVSGILVTTIGTMVLLNNSTIKATDEVTMQTFNELKAEVETLRENINTTKEELTICKTSNENLKVEVNNLKTQTTNNASEISKTKNDLTEVANRTSKIEAREDYLYSQGSNFSTSNFLRISKHINENLK